MTASQDAASTADELLERATDVPFRGWNFTLLGDRLTLEPPPWSLEAMVAELVEPGTTMLDMGTGGGEWLSGLARSSRVVATESWAPNVPVAAARLQPLGIAVVRDEGAADNVDQERQDRAGPARPVWPFGPGRSTSSSIVTRPSSPTRCAGSCEPAVCS